MPQQPIPHAGDAEQYSTGEPFRFRCPYCGTEVALETLLGPEISHGRVVGKQRRDRAGDPPAGVDAFVDPVHLRLTPDRPDHTVLEACRDRLSHVVDPRPGPCPFEPALLNA